MNGAINGKDTWKFSCSSQTNTLPVQEKFCQPVNSIKNFTCYCKTRKKHTDILWTKETFNK